MKPLPHEQVGIPLMFTNRRGGRVAEGAPLLRGEPEQEFDPVDQISGERFCQDGKSRHS